MNKKTKHKFFSIRSLFFKILKILFTILIIQVLISKIHTQNISVNDSLRLVFATDTIFSPTKQLDLAISLIDGFASTNPKKASEYNRTAIELAEQLNDTTKIISLLIRYGKNENKQCNYQNANKAFQLAKGLISSLKTNNEKAEIFYIIGSNYYDWSNYSESESYYQLSIENYESLGNKKGLAQAYKGLSAIASNYGDYELAIGYMQQARDIYNEIGDTKSLVVTTLGLGVILENWNQTDKALSYYNQAYNHFKSENNKLQEINLLLHIGDIYLKQEKYTKAISSYNEAIEIEKKVKNKKLLSIGYSNLGEAYFAIHEYTKALSYQEKALAIKYKVGDKKRIAISLQNIGEIYFAIKEFELSEDTINKCLKLSRELNLKEIEMKALLMLSKISKQNLDFKSSQDFLEKYIKLKEEVFTEKNQKIVNNLYVKYEANRIEKENELLNQKDSIRTLELESEKETKYFIVVFLLFIIALSITLIIFITSRTKQARQNLALVSKKNKEITIQKEKLDELNKQFAHNKEQYRSIVENSTTGMYQTLPTGEIKFANMSLIRMLGYNNFSDLKNINLNKEKRNRKKFIDLLNKQMIISGREDIWIKHDNSSMYVNESAWIVKDDDGNVIHYEGIVEDITKRKEAEFELQKSQKELQRINTALKLKNKEFELAKNEAIEANEAKSLFIANVSHEIRTPMNSIIGFSTLLSNTITDKNLLSNVNAIKSSSKNLLTIINDVLDMSKIQAGEVEISYQPVSFVNLIDGIKQTFKLKLNNKKIEFVSIINDSVPTNLFLDKIRMRQILLNLIGNSIKFTDKGSITVEINASKIKSNKVDLSVSITDTGIGVPEDDQKTIFEAFKQSSINPNSNEGGTGLGLSISNRLVKLMGGNIKLESKYGSGSKFTILLPNVDIATGESDVSPQYEIVTHTMALPIDENDEFQNIQSIPTFDKEIQDELILLFKERWLVLINSHVINEIVAFTNDLSKFSIRKNEPQLTRYCESLLFSLSNFEIDNINKLIINLDQVFNIDEPK